VADESDRYESLLAHGERIILVKQRHWLTFLEAARWFVLALVAGIVVVLLNSSVSDDGFFSFLSTGLTWIFWALLLVGVLGIGWFVLVWRVERYVVTTRRVIEVGGVINKYSKDTSLQMITDMIVGHPWLGRIVGYGEIDLLTASESGTTKIRFLPDADGFKKALLDARHEYELELGGGRGAPDAPSPAAAPAPAAPTSAEGVDAALTHLADMRSRGVITQAEFDEKKRELLDRL
jgi:Bacterial PH domain/Short C-terminal domain